MKIRNGFNWLRIAFNWL